MKTIFKISLLITAAITAKAQDTICFKNNTCINAKILEVNSREVKYLKEELSDGPVYVASGNDIRFLKYKNGVVDSIKTTAVSVLQSQDTMYVVEPITIEGKRLIYNDRSLSDRKLKYLINDYPVPQTREELKRAFSRMKRCEVVQKVYAPIGFAAGFGVVVGSMIYAFEQPFIDSEQNATIVATGIIGGAIIRITSHVIYNVYRNKRFAARKRIALMYNQNL